MKLTLTTPHSMDNKEVQLQFELAPPPIFKSIDKAIDWALTNLPYGVYIELHDGRKTLRASGVVAGKVQVFAVKSPLTCPFGDQGCLWCEIYGEHGL